MASKKKPFGTEEPATTLKSKTAANTVALSSDMESLYVIDSGKLLEFSLTNPNGVLIGTLKGQVIAATADKLPADAEILNKIVLPLKGAQWTTFYHRPAQTLHVIGATDIDLSFTESSNVKAQLHRITIGTNPVHLHRSGSNIIIYILKP
jgi:hypothetical protein